MKYIIRLKRIFIISILIVTPLIFGLNKSFATEIIVAQNIEQLGDVNNSGTIDMGDIIQMLRHISASSNGSNKEWILSEQKIKIADININGKVDMGDIMSALRYLSAINNKKIAKENPEWLNLGDNDKETANKNVENNKNDNKEMDNKVERIDNKKYIAHKGASKLAPENTLQAFRLATNANVFGVETDVRMTKDNILICNHDSTVDRTTNGTGLVKNLMYNSYIKNLKVDIGTQNKNEIYRIATFSEYLDVIKNSNCYAIVELKQSDKKFINEVLEKIKSKNMQSKTIIISFDYSSLEYIRKDLKNNIELGYLTRTNSLNTIDLALKLNNTIICPYYLTITSEFISYAHNNNIKINTWTVDSNSLKEMLFDLKIDYITTNKL